MPPRLEPLQPPYPDGVEDALRRLMGSRPPAVDAPPLALFRTIAHHDVLLDRFRQIGASMLSFGRLDAADRETVIHRTTARCGASYEWGVHAVAFAGPLGLGEDWLAATWAGAADDPAFTPRQALLVRAVDELHDDAAWSAATWAALREAYADDELVELACLVGFYHLVSFVCGAFAVEPEPWAARPPAPSPAPPR
ncbi:MAG: carboxymuconolactone decarboxylase family protein [Solirubrobacterales bacterium]|nr:carboxymuconolactone decarboxylase family protein [Solirubrobacterales bacterium]